MTKLEGQQSIVIGQGDGNYEHDMRFDRSEFGTLDQTISISAYDTITRSVKTILIPKSQWPAFVIMCQKQEL